MNSSYNCNTTIIISVTSNFKVAHHVCTQTVVKNIDFVAKSDWKKTFAKNHIIKIISKYGLLLSHIM
jgi:hypothetical protein